MPGEWGREGVVWSTGIVSLRQAWSWLLASIRTGTGWPYLAFRRGLSLPSQICAPRPRCKPCSGLLILFWPSGARLGEDGVQGGMMLSFLFLDVGKSEGSPRPCLLPPVPVVLSSPLLLSTENRAWQALSQKGPGSKHFRLSPPLCHWSNQSNHRQFVNRWAWLCPNKILFTKMTALWIWTVGGS